MIHLTKDMTTGIAKVDEQHQELVKMLNGLLSMGTQAIAKEEMKKAIDFLGDYVMKHFNEEESLQRQSSYKKYEMHKEQHKEFINTFKVLKEDFAVNGPSAKFVVSLNSSVISWIVKHIKGADVEFGKYYQEQNQPK